MTKQTERLHTKYNTEIAAELAKKYAIKNKMAIPTVTKVVLNTGLGDTSKNKELLESAKKDLAAITGQMPSVRKAKNSVASFGIRKGIVVGLKVTLRKEKMYAFLDKLFSIVLPRIRDFRGVTDKSFDKFGNYTLGLREHSVFPEIDTTKSKSIGLEVTIVTNSNSREQVYDLLKLLGMPFEKKD
jgi:large subunit ribosomal protein L5